MCSRPQQDFQPSQLASDFPNTSAVAASNDQQTYKQNVTQVLTHKFFPSLQW